MNNRYYHKVINVALNPLSAGLAGMDTNYELIRIIPYNAYSVIAVFIEHPIEDIES